MDVESAVRVVQYPVVDPLVRVAAAEVLQSHFAGVQLLAVGEVVDADPGFEHPEAGWVEPGAAEVACALRWTPGVASARAELARDLRANLPMVLAALLAGRVDLVAARMLSEGSTMMDPISRAELAVAGVEYAASHTRGQLRSWLARQVANYDPEAAERRRDAARRRRRVWITPEADGMATLGVFLTAEEAAACLAAVRGQAANVDGSVGGNQADVVVALLTGTRVGAPLPVQVIVTEDGPAIDGYGPISPTHAKALCGHADLITLTTPNRSIGYTPAARLAVWVRVRDRHCRFPGCQRPARGCDLDHIIPHPAGATDRCNLACLCRYHHKLKTHSRWRVTALPGMGLKWTSPRGHTYTTWLNDP